MAKHKSPEYLAKFISYILGRNPAEFGLVPDPEGFVKIKEFLKVLSEEEGLKYVRRSNLNEILVTLPNPPVEIRENHIRAKQRQTILLDMPAQNLPKLLYTCVRRKAYPSVLENGIRPMGFSHIILSSDAKMAERIGRRKDPVPVQLVVHTKKSSDRGITFYEAGETLYLAESIQPDCFTGPPLPKPKDVPIKPKTPEKEAVKKTPGSFLMTLKNTKAYDKTAQRKKKRIDAARGKESKKIRKPKRKRERPPWRQ